ncbi:MAG: sulfotransferase [Cyanobacteria bacterium P01_G01_bin.38]
MNLSPIFIVGVPRSGTTLLASLLSAHPAIAISPESHFFNYWLPTWGNLPLETLWQELRQSQRFSYFGMDADTVWARTQTKGQPTQQTLFESMLETYAAQLNKPRWGEKTPMHYQHLDQIFDWYPNASVLWLLRDPRAVVSSLLKAHWASDYTDENARLWHQGLRHYEHHWKTDARVKQVRYEALLTQPQDCLKQICEFLDEPYPPDLIDCRSAANSPIVNRPKWAANHLRQALAPLEMTPLEKWKQQLSRARIEIIEQISRDAMARYGYTPITSGKTLRGQLQWRREQLTRKLTGQLQHWQQQLGMGQTPLTDWVHGTSSRTSA